MPIAEIETAIARFKEGDIEAAIPVLEQAARMVPSYILAHVMLAQAYEATQQEDKAVASWAKAHSLIPNSPLRATPIEDQDPDFAAFLDHLNRIDAGELPAADASPEVQLSSAADELLGAASPSLSYAVRSVYGRRGVRPHPETTAVTGGSTLLADGLVKRYRKRSVVKSVSLEVRQGEIVGLLGPNGAGKTTTFYMIVGLVRPDGGRVLLDETELTPMPMYRRARKGIGYLAQEASIFTQLSVEQNLEAVLEYQPLSKADRRQRVNELIDEFGLHRVRKSKGYMLSGGERRRTEIARALATRPKFFLLDEPFAGVDPIAVEDIQAVVAGLKARGIGVLITDHNVHETLAITDRAYLLYEGKILKQGSAEALVNDEEVRRRYLGEKFTLERYQAS